MVRLRRAVSNSTNGYNKLPVLIPGIDANGDFEPDLAQGLVLNKAAYDLCGVIEHSGRIFNRATGGHYVAILRFSDRW